jgi:hypothetical protein
VPPSRLVKSRPGELDLDDANQEQDYDNDDDHTDDPDTTVS